VAFTKLNVEDSPLKYIRQKGRTLEIRFILMASDTTAAIPVIQTTY
jgi:hypothetical protein